jgi:uncharacterized protein YndB with AHSA1/START domain
MADAPVVERTVEIRASLEIVWSLVASQEGLRRWFDPTMEIDLTVGGSFRLREEESQGPISGHVLEVVPLQRLVLSWLEEGGWIHPTRLTFTLEETPEGTRVCQRYDGFAGIGSSTWQRARDAYEAGIDRHGLLKNLKRLAESAAAA